ncbi:hypothetical protein HPB51_022044 [Rhipicephalus microplus]|uniref:Uncharacterized protein n=1 Tax=Rhipicephalus microplus TaxID=6941 RepID=A0A9J6DWM5_RHIMP|nr:hypothetical protein HPB51_022044 [Rhipicephalus microplus]
MLAPSSLYWFVFSAEELMQPGSLLCTIGQGFQRTTYTFPPDGLCNIITFDSLYRKHASLAPPYPKDFEYFLETAKKHDNLNLASAFIEDPKSRVSSLPWRSHPDGGDKIASEELSAHINDAVSELMSDRINTQSRPSYTILYFWVPSSLAVKLMAQRLHNFPHFKMAASGDGTLSASAAAWPSPAQRKPRKRLRIDGDLCLLKEVVCADPFSNPAAWEDVLRNVMRAVNRELTIRDIKERVDLLIGYFQQQDTVNLRKSGTEEQYEERKQLLQDVSDLMRDVDYAPRTVPRKTNGMGPSKKNGVGPRQPAQQLASAKARRAQALQFRDAAMASLPAVWASDDGQKNGK